MRRNRVAAWLVTIDDFLAGWAARSEQDPRRRSHWALLLVILVGAFVMLCRLGETEVCGFNEAVEAIAVQRMVEHHELLFPLLNGSDPMYKPPLFHWTATALARLVGTQHVSEITVRLPSVLYGTAGVLLTVLFVNRLLGLHAALLAGLVLVASYQYVSQGRLARVDMTLTFFETLALFAFATWLYTNESACGARRGHGSRGTTLHYVLALALGLAVLAKGPVGAFLPGLAIGIFLLRERRWQAVRNLCRPGPVLVSLAVAGSWYLACYLGGQDAFLSRQLRSENFGRFFGGLGTMTPWYYLHPLLLSSPVSLLVPIAVFHALGVSRRHGSAPEERAASATEPAVKLLAIFWITTVVFFSIAAYKRRAYLLPLWPAAAVLLVWWLRETAVDRRGKMLRGAVVTLSTAMVAINLAYILGYKDRECDNSPYRRSAAAIKTIAPLRDHLRLYSCDLPMPLVFYLDRTIEPVAGQLDDVSSGYVLVTSGSRSDRNEGGSRFEDVLTLAVGKEQLVLLRRQSPQSARNRPSAGSTARAAHAHLSRLAP